jgi:hypothetical protein
MATSFLSTSRPLLVAGTALIVVATTASCGSGQNSDSGEPAAREPETSLSSPESEQDSKESDYALWSSFAQLAEGAEESESYPTLSEMATRADATVVGTVKSIRLGRIVASGGTVPALPFAEFLIEPSSTLGSDAERQEDGTILLEVPFMPTSPELEAAVRAAIDSDAVGRASTDDELAAATNDEQIQAAYDKYYSEAIEQTISRMNSTRPSAESLFLLRKQPSQIKDLPPGAYRLVNGSALIVDSAGKAVLPLRLEPSEDPIGREIVDQPFETIVRDVESVR